MEKEILDELKDILAMVKPGINPAAVTMESRLLEDLGLDSLTLLLVSLGIEKKYNMRFDDTVRLNTVQDVVDCVMKSR